MIKGEFESLSEHDDFGVANTVRLAHRFCRRISLVLQVTLIGV